MASIVCEISNPPGMKTSTSPSPPAFTKRENSAAASSHTGGPFNPTRRGRYSISGGGSVVVAGALMLEPLNFVTMIALLMLCGLSVDFGVFAVDEWRQREAEPERTE